VHETTLVRKSTVRSDENVGSDSLAENLDLERIGNDLLGLTVDIRVNERNVVVTGNDVSKSTQPLLNSLQGNGGREGIAKMLKLLVGCGGWEKETVTDPN